jgi:prepilin-type N-terminal cleavage/methylation domain-containing protein/prepilin-type processing-associated H-X9-DG protein
MSRQRGFTLIELLVVIAIIAILAAMLFPVFARARESARKIQCLSNVKNIATAVQMYLVDYERFVPNEHRQEVLDWYAVNKQGGELTECAQHSATRNNPYLKWQVVLEEYVRNRDVWRCPSARAERSSSILNPFAGNARGDWWARTMEIVGERGDSCSAVLMCSRPFPPGWGGSITDSATQYQCILGGTGGFEYSYGGLRRNNDLKTSQIDQPSRWLAIAEVGVADDQWSIFHVAYPDVCGLGCASCDWGPSADWANCPWSQDCGAGSRDYADPTWRAKNLARHMGGVNLGFADGHAAWMNSEALLKAGPDWRWFRTETRSTEELGIVGPGLGLCMMPEAGDPGYYR